MWPVTLTYTANALNQYTNILRVSAPPREDLPLFDLDGNLTNYNGWSFAWDAENRLIKAANGSTVVSNHYDHMSRRVSKSVNGSARQFLYDGWAMVQESAGAQTNSYVYGLDLSGSIQGAGTIGGLLSANLDGMQAFYFFDANGNVSDLVASHGTNLAHYEFDPYGNATASSGSLAVVNPFRFSTKYTDDETGLLYYGYRYLITGLGRWVSRDPLEETVGDNIIAFVCNSPLVSYDPFGLWQPGGTINDDRRRIYTKEPGDTWQGLADKLELRLEEIHKWAKPYGNWNSPNFNPNACAVSVPNVWISADIISGGSLWSEITSVGGSVGQFIGTDLATYGFKIVKPTTIQGLGDSGSDLESRKLLQSEVGVW